MRTKRGWLGLGPKGAHSDDAICILYGCSVPVVLRKVMKSEKDVEEMKKHAKLTRPSTLRDELLNTHEGEEIPEQRENGR
jgi:hypothetical protein